MTGVTLILRTFLDQIVKKLVYNAVKNKAGKKMRWQIASICYSYMTAIEYSYQ